MKTFDDSARARIATGWLNSSFDQATYAAQHGISERTLREWVRRYAAGRRPQAQLRASIVASIEQLQNVLAALDAEAAAGSAAVVDDRHDVAERHASPEATVTPPGAMPVSPLSSSTTTPRDAEREAGPRGQAATTAADAGEHVPAMAAPATVAVVDRSGERPAPSCQARAAEQNEPRPPQSGAAACVLDIEALRKRVRAARAARAASGAPRRNPFLEWDSE